MHFNLCITSDHNTQACNYVNNYSTIAPNVTKDLTEIVNTDDFCSNKNKNINVDNCDNECVICYDNKYKNGCVSLKCGHDYCVDCFVEHMRSSNTCAYCRIAICSTPKPNKKISPEVVRRLLVDCFSITALNEIRFDIYEQLLPYFNIKPNTKYVTITDIHAAFGYIDIQQIKGISSLVLDVIHKLASWYERE